MKKYLLGVFAVVLAIGFSAFTTSEAPVKAEKKQVVVILVLKAGTPPQNQIASYDQVSTAPSCPGAVSLCALRVTDPNSDGVITQAEFNTIFAGFDTNSNGTLNDQTETANLLKKA